MRRALLLLIGILMALLAPRAAAASTPRESQTRVWASDLESAYCTHRLVDPTDRIPSRTSAPSLRLASDPPLRWKGMWRLEVAGTELYDARARMWSPALGPFLSIDEYDFHDPRATLWAWPNQNPITFSDPFGRDGTTHNPIQDLADSNLLPPGLTLFGKGTRLRASGISMMANDATFEAGMAKMNCGNAIIGAGAAPIASADRWSDQR